MCRLVFIAIVFFLQRDAMQSAVYAVVVCLCVCVCLSAALLSTASIRTWFYFATVQ